MECDVEGGSPGETYDRAKLLQSHNYNVEILGHPITEVMLEEAGQDYILNNIEYDVGIYDSTKLQIWSLTDHPVVVMMDYDILINKPLDFEIDMLIANDDMKGMYILNAPDQNTGGAGVDTAFMMVKPSIEELDTIVNLYLNTTYYPYSGWNGQGYNDFEGGMVSKPIIRRNDSCDTKN